MAKSTTKGGRAVICHGPKHIAMRFGKGHSQFNPGFQVKDQPVPTDKDHLRLHQKLARGK